MDFEAKIAASVASREGVRSSKRLKALAKWSGKSIVLGVLKGVKGSRFGGQDINGKKFLNITLF